jgi:phosphatidylinositol glycan class W
VIYVLPALFCTTLASEHINWITFGLAIIGFLIPSKTQTHEKESVPFKSHLTVYRAGTMILTCIAILAVDFQVFPRRFAKVETFGTSLVKINKRGKRKSQVYTSCPSSLDGYWCWFICVFFGNCCV